MYKSIVPLWRQRRHTKKKKIGSRLGDFLGSAEGGHFCPSPLHLRTLLDKMGIFNKHRKNIVYLLRYFAEIYGRELYRTKFLAAHFPNNSEHLFVWKGGSAIKPS
jgi:hypothetical protein